MAARKRTRPFSRTAWIFALLTLFLAIFAAVLASGNCYHLSMHVDGDGLSETLRAALVREQLSIDPLFDALETESDISPSDLHAHDSLLAARLETLEELTAQVDRALEYLAERNIGEAASARYSGQLHRLNALADQLELVLRVMSYNTLALLVLAALLLLFRRNCAAALLAGAAALLAGMVPLLPLTLAGRLLEAMTESLSVIRLYGVSYEAQLTLTDSGKALVLLAAGALLFCTACCLLSTRKPKRRPQARQ